MERDVVLKLIGQFKLQRLYGKIMWALGIWQYMITVLRQSLKINAAVWLLPEDAQLRK